ncbi:MAG: hypothetical protein J6C96_02795 [Oscillospiraceae bacterium]|nr:hypothetical protein [Oscillospiraceae bacterium]
MSETVNSGLLPLLLKFGGGMLGLLLIVWLIALLTPKAAKLIDRIAGKNKPDDPSPERVGDNFASENDYKVYSVFEDRPKGAVNGTENKKDNAKGE